MGHRADHLMGRIAGQLRVGIQRDDVSPKSLTSPTTSTKRRAEMLLSAQTDPEEVEQNAEDGEGGDGEYHPG